MLQEASELRTKALQYSLDVGCVPGPGLSTASSLESASIPILQMGKTVPLWSQITCSVSQSQQAESGWWLSWLSLAAYNYKLSAWTQHTLSSHSCWGSGKQVWLGLGLRLGTFSTETRSLVLGRGGCPIWGWDLGGSASRLTQCGAECSSWQVVSLRASASCWLLAGSSPLVVCLGASLPWWPARSRPAREVVALLDGVSDLCNVIAYSPSPLPCSVGFRASHGPRLPSGGGNPTRR